MCLCRRYGLLGLNGCGKSTLLTSIGMREVPIPEHMDIYHLTREIDATDLTALEAVMNVDEERLELEKEVERLVAQVNECLSCHRDLCRRRVWSCYLARLRGVSSFLARWFRFESVIICKGRGRIFVGKSVVFFCF